MRGRAGSAITLLLLLALLLSACGKGGGRSTEWEADRLNAAAETLDLNSVSAETPAGQDDQDNDQQENEQ